MKKKSSIFKQRNFYLPLISLVVAALLNFVSSELIAHYFPGRTAPEDLLFRLTPYIPWTQYLTDLANLFSFALIGYYIFAKNIKDSGYALSVFALAYFLRAILILLTPLGGSFGNNMQYGLTNIQQHGCFPSGHTLMVVLAYMLIDQVKEPLLKKVALVSILVEIVSLILSRGHYSIDIAGAMLLAYFSLHYLKENKPSLAIDPEVKFQSSAGTD